jgi:hemerythrin superfamily protein
MALFGLVDTTTGIVHMLQDDHRRVEALFEEFKQAETAAARARIAKQAILELKVHAAIEEELFYPAVRNQSEDEHAGDLTGESIEEHHVVKLLIGELERLTGREDAFKHKFTVLSELVVHHAQEEESEMFPMAEAAGLDLERLRDRAQERKQALMKEFRGGRSGAATRSGRGGRSRGRVSSARSRPRGDSRGRGRRSTAARRR